MLCEFSELDWLFQESGDIGDFLDRIVTLVARHMQAESCSIFLWDSGTETLKLEATVGLNREVARHVEIRSGEGFSGLAFREKRIIRSLNAAEKEQYKFIPGLQEEQYGALMAVPIYRGVSGTGVLLLERKHILPFTPLDSRAIRVVASQLANIIENARIQLQLFSGSGSLPAAEGITYRDEAFFSGTGASDGFAHGPVRILNKEKQLDQIAREASRYTCTREELKRAMTATEKELQELQSSIEGELYDSASLIFTSHLLMLKDPDFHNRVEGLIAEGLEIPEAIVRVGRDYIQILKNSPNAYIREKVKDLEDLLIRILQNLLPGEWKEGGSAGKIVLARDIYPSDMLALASEKAGGIILTSGGMTAHISILSQSLNIPVVIVDRPELNRLTPGHTALIDGHNGEITLQPAETSLKTFEEKKNNHLRLEQVRHNLRNVLTADGKEVRIMANVNLFPDVKKAVQRDVEGIGLCRTEFPFLIRQDLPSEEEQYAIYRKMVEAAGGRPITFRTLDIGGDKILPYYADMVKEDNPFLGLRSIRFSLRHREIFVQQIRALLRATYDVESRIMFPMISSLDEFRTARAMVQEAIEELRQEGQDLNPHPAVGVMLEIPSVLGIIDELTAEADFLSIGTNDFIQYTLAVDRTNAKLSDYYLPHHPAVLRGLRIIARAASHHNKELSICGEMAHQEPYLPFLIGIGIRNFSVGTSYLPQLYEALRRLDTAHCRIYAGQLLKESSLAGIEAIIGRGVPGSPPPEARPQPPDGFSAATAGTKPAAKPAAKAGEEPERRAEETEQGKDES